MEQRDNDMFLEVMLNPGFTNTEFKSAGVNANNTSLASADVYKNNTKIREEFTQNGTFNEAAFNATYDKAVSMYNRMSDDTWIEDAVNSAVYSRNNIFVSPEKRSQGAQLAITFDAEPFRNNREWNQGIYDIHESAMTGRSVEEIAQTQGVHNLATGEIDVAPNDSFFDNFFETKVLAQWEFNADINGNPTDIESEIVYQKGDLKLNENKLPYYETLNGRSIVGKTILHKSDIITTDGSVWNKFDFFDSDDLEKSTAGVIAKNLVTIAPMLVGGTVSAAYIGTGVVLNSLGLLNTGAKMVFGSDEKFLNGVEGFLESISLSANKTQSKSAWTLNNFIDLGGEVFKQLAEQRWLFKYGSLLLKGGKGKIDEKTLADLQKNKLEKLNQKLDDELKALDIDERRFLQLTMEGRTNNAAKASKYVQDYIKQQHKIGEELSRLYMVGITTADGYNQAKLEGLSDFEAALYTLGYALGEYAILKSDIGKWVMPELKYEAYRTKQIINKIAPKIPKGLEKAADGIDMVKQNKARELIFKGLEKSKIENKLGTKLSQFAIANAFGEGVEETTEELLADMSKSLFNASAEIFGSDSRFTSQWTNMFDRYSMSFVGGMLGGGLFSMTKDLKNAYKYTMNMDKEQATKEMITMVRDGKKEDLFKQINKSTFASEYLSLDRAENEASGFLPAEKGESQNDAIKKVLVTEINNIENILNQSGVNISNDQLLETMTLKDIRFSRLVNSTQALRFIEDFEGLLEEYVNLEIQTKPQNLTDGAKKREKDAEEAIEQITGTDLNKEAESRKKELLTELKSFISGEKSNSYIMKSIFEMETGINNMFIYTSFNRWAEHHTGKKLKDLNENDKKELLVKFNAYKSGDLKNHVDIAHEIFQQILDKVSPDLNIDTVNEILNDSEFSKNLQEKVINLGLVQDPLNIKQYEGKLRQLLSVQIARDLIESIGQISPIQQKESELEIANKELLEVYDNIQKLDSEISDLQKQLKEAEKNETEEGKKNKLSEKINNLNEEINNLKGNQEIKEENIKILEEQYKDTIVSIIAENSGSIYDVVGNIDETTKDFLLFSLQDIVDQYSSNLDMFPEEEEEQSLNNLKTLISNIQEKETSGVYRILNHIGLSLGKDVNMGSLMRILNSSLSNVSHALENFSTDQLETINEAKVTLGIVRSILNAIKTNATLTHVYGYSAIYNELFPDNPKLPEIDSFIVDPLVKEMDDIEQHLNYISKISGLNTSNTLNAQTQIGRHAIYLLHSKIKSFSKLLDGWEGVDELIAALDNAINIKSKSQDDLLIEQEKKAMELALHNLFAKNKDKLSNVEEMSKIFSLENFPSIVSFNDDIITTESTNINDLNFFWYLAAIAAINPSDFYYNYKDKITDKIAPIITQEYVTFTNYAFSQNGAMFETFQNILINTLKTQKAEAVDELYDPEYIDSGIFPRFLAVLSEGIAGAGKSTATLNNTSAILGESHPLLKNVHVYHSSKENAKQIAENANIKATKFGTKEDILRFCSPDYLSMVSTDSSGNQIINGTIKKDENQINKLKFTVNKHTDPPSLFIIDEISLWSTFDLDVVYDYCKLNGTRLLILGDLHQTSLEGQVKLDNGNTLILNLYRGNFISPIKLGFSMRSANIQQDYNSKLLRTGIQEGKLPENAKLRYYEDENGIYGFKSHVFTSNKDAIIQDAKKLVSTLKDGEKIGYIYEGEEPEILNELEKLPEFQNKIIRYKGTSSSGVEGQYFIFDATSSNFYADRSRKNLKKIYTGITRATQGGLILYDPESEWITSGNPDNYTTIKKLNEDVIAQFSKKRKEILNKVYSTGSQIHYNPLYKKQTQDSSSEEEPEQLPDEQAQQEEQQEETNKKNSITRFQNLSASLGSKAQLLWKFNTDWFTSEDGIDRAINAIKNLTDKQKEQFKKALKEFKNDSLFGIKRVFDKVVDEGELVKIYNALKSSITFGKSEEQIVQNIRDILINESVRSSKIELDILYRSSAEGIHKGFERFSTVGNILHYMYNQNADIKAPRKYISAEITITTKNSESKKIEIPLYTLNNYESILKTEGFEKFKEINDALNEELKDSEIKEFNKVLLLADRIKEAVNSSNDDNFKIRGNNLITQLKLYNFGENGAFYLSKKNAQGQNEVDLFLASQIHTGPIIASQDIINDANYATYTAIQQELSDFTSGRLVISKPMVVNNARSILGIEKGRPFILVSDNTLIQENQLLSEYEKQQNNINSDIQVSLICLDLPALSIEEYVNKLVKQSKDIKSLNTRIGTETTNFKLAYVLIKTIEANKGSNAFLNLQDSDKILAAFESVYNELYDEKGKRRVDVKTILDRMRKKDDGISEALGGEYAKKSVKTASLMFIQKILPAYKNKETFVDDFIQNAKGLGLTQGILVSPKTGNKVIEGIAEAVFEDSNFTFKVSGKLDPSATAADMSIFYQAIEKRHQPTVKEIDVNGTKYTVKVIDKLTEKDQDTFRYLDKNQKKSKTQPGTNPEPDPDPQTETETPKYISDLFDKLEERFRKELLQEEISKAYNTYKTNIESKIKRKEPLFVYDFMYLGEPLNVIIYYKNKTFYVSDMSEIGFKHIQYSGNPSGRFEIFNDTGNIGYVQFEQVENGSDYEAMFYDNSKPTFDMDGAIRKLPKIQKPDGMDEKEFAEIINIEYVKNKKIFQSYKDTYLGLSNKGSEFNLAQAVGTIISNDGDFSLAKIKNLINYLKYVNGKEIDGIVEHYFDLDDNDRDNLIEYLNEIAEAIKNSNTTNDNCGKKLNML